MDSTLENPQNTSGSDISKHWAAVHWMVLIFIVLMSLWLRMDDLIAWRHQPHRAFYDGQPLLITFDGYYYLSLARDLQKDTYDPADLMRGVPDPQSRPAPPPLISVLAAFLSSLLSVSLNWVGVLLPPLLGIGLAVPLYLFGRLYGGRMMALVAVCTGLCANYYLYRSNLGWFDTDCMNVTFAFSITYLFVRFGLENRLRRYIYLAGGGVGYLLFLMWWDQAAQAVTLISIAPLLIVLLLFYRPKGRERWIAVGIAVTLLAAVLVWQGSQPFVSAYKKVMGTLGYLSKQQAGDFPNIGVSIFEQKRLTLEALVRKTMGNYPAFFVGLAGIGWLIWRKKREAAALGILFLLGCFSFLFARRFLIFLNPFVAIGIGFVLQKLWDMRRQWGQLQYVAPLLALLVCFATAWSSIGKVYWPKEIPPIIAGMDYLAKESAENAVVWAWWDHGYPLLYWGQRATVNDGSVHGGLRTVCNALPFAVRDQKLAANFMHFYVVRGTRGMKQLFQTMGGADQGMRLLYAVLEAGAGQAGEVIARAGLAPEGQWRNFFFPPIARDIYLFLDLRVARTTYWWYWFGTWDVGRKDGRRSKFRLIRNVREGDNGIKGPELEADLTNGRVTYRGKTYPLSQAFVQDGADQTQTTFPGTNGLVFTLHKAARVGAVMEQEFAGSVFSQLFMTSAGDSKNFTKVAEQYPYYQIWRVSADR